MIALSVEAGHVDVAEQSSTFSWSLTPQITTRQRFNSSSRHRHSPSASQDHSAPTRRSRPAPYPPYHNLFQPLVCVTRQLKAHCRTQLSDPGLVTVATTAVQALKHGINHT